MRAARTVVSPLPAIVDEPAAPAQGAGSSGDSARLGEGGF